MFAAVFLGGLCVCVVAVIPSYLGLVSLCKVDEEKLGLRHGADRWMDAARIKVLACRDQALPLVFRDYAGQRICNGSSQHQSPINGPSS